MRATFCVVAVRARRLGRYTVQLWGFVAMAVNFFAVAYLLGLDLPPSARWTMLVCFGFTCLGLVAKKSPLPFYSRMA